MRDRTGCLGFIGLDAEWERRPDAGKEGARRPEVGKSYVTNSGDRTAPVRASRENPFGAAFEATIPGSNWIAFYNENGECLNASHELNLKDILNQ